MKSTSLLEPATFIALIGWVVVIGLGFYLRKKQPVISFAIFWFLAGYFLEASVFPLELYFEHRNYLPMLGPLFAVAYFLNKALSGDIKKYAGLSAIVVISLGSVAWGYSSVWGDPRALVDKWAEKQPHSLRAQITQTIAVLQSAPPAQGMARIEALRQQFPDLLGVEVLHVEGLCMLGRLREEDFKKVLYLARNQSVDNQAQNTLAHLVSVTLAGACKQLGPAELLMIIDTVLKNRSIASNDNFYIKLQMLKYQIYNRYGRLVEALEALDSTFSKKANFDVALLQAKLLMNKGLYAPAVVQLNKAEAIDKLRRRAWLVPSRLAEVEALRAKLP